MSTIWGTQDVCSCTFDEKITYEIFFWKIIKSCNWKAHLSQPKNHQLWD